MSEDSPLDQLAHEEATALSLLLQGDPAGDRQVYVMAIVARLDGSTTSTATCSATRATRVQVLGFAQGLERQARRLRNALEEIDHA